MLLTKAVRPVQGQNDEERWGAAEMLWGYSPWVDAVVAVVALIALAPLLIVIAMAVLIGSGTPVVFCQERVGWRGRRFWMFKFRTMRWVGEGLQVTAADDERVTRVGRFLRRTKLDELPELLNVARGDMSLVGPRPEVPRYVDMSNLLWQGVLETRPGLSDPVTLLLRNEEELLGGVQGDREAFYLNVLQPRKLEGYLTYLSRRSTLSDLRVLVASVVAVATAGRRSAPGMNAIRRGSGFGAEGKKR